MTGPLDPQPASVVVEADGGSRGNPGAAAYGALLKDAATGAVLAEAAERIGTASNNVAEYRGLIAGLELRAELAPDAALEVRMDSKLVVEQMAGTWKIKHPDMRRLAADAQRLVPFGTTWTWIPRAENAHADRLANEALDGTRSGVTYADHPGGALEDAPEPAPTAPAPSRGWAPTSRATTLVLVRHGVTEATGRKAFSGGLAGHDPGLTDEGRAQVRETAAWLRPLVGTVDALVSSPVRRTRESAEILAGELGLRPSHEPGFAEMEFGAWEGLTFGEVHERDPDALATWLADPRVRAGGHGESFAQVRERVLEGLARVQAAHPDGTVVVASHVTPIKMLVAQALHPDQPEAALAALRRMELSPASVTTVSFYADGGASLRQFNAGPRVR